MENANNFNKGSSGTATAADVPVWVKSLLPVGAGFLCYVGLILGLGIEPRGRLLAYGAAAAFIGLECYWILRGLRDNHLVTMVTGFVGAAMAILVLDLFLAQY